MKLKLKASCSHKKTILEAIKEKGVFFSAPCAGRGVCGKCKVRLLSGETEGDLPDKNGMVRACRSVLKTDVEIELTNSAFSRNEVLKQNNAFSGGKGAIALDIGTTTVSAYLADITKKTLIDSVSLLNEQSMFGADVISRINACREGKTRCLFEKINTQTNAIIKGFKKKHSIDEIESIVVSANTTMLHLFVCVDASSMGVVPFSPVFTDLRRFKGSELGLDAKRVVLMPSASAFVGGDIIAGLASLPENETALTVDLGTNCEMALRHNGKIYCCSTAAGPALEGVEISCGVGGVDGGINRIYYENDVLKFSTVSSMPPIGICGCALIDAIALMLERGVIDETGAMSIEGDFKITDSISITARDIRQFQLAKSAIRTGLSILFKVAGIDFKSVERVYIAGGLGFFIDKNNIFLSGLMPREFENKIIVSGNLSLKGASLALFEDDFFDKCVRIKNTSINVDLATDPDFNYLFAENMLFED